VKLSLGLALNLIEAATLEARAKALAPLAVAVVDGGGHLLALHRQDGASSLRPAIAIAKAAGALSMGVSSRRLSEIASQRPQFLNALVQLSPQGLVPSPGGLLIKGDDEDVIGAIGISGDAPDNDELCAAHAIAATNLIAVPA
jgi:uncharacterized protein GlcG (DUF336 family)